MKARVTIAHREICSPNIVSPTLPSVAMNDLLKKQKVRLSINKQYFYTRLISMLTYLKQTTVLSHRAGVNDGFITCKYICRHVIPFF